MCQDVVIYPSPPNVAANIDAIKIATYDGMNQLKLSIITMTNTISTM